MSMTIHELITISMTLEHLPKLLDNFQTPMPVLREYIKRSQLILEREIKLKTINPVTGKEHRDLEKP